MYKFIKSRFIRNYDKTSDPSVRIRYGIVAGIFGIVTNVVLFVFKILAGVLSGSISVVADAVNNLSDAGSSVVTVLGFRLSGRPADAEHPYGHARYEYITGFIVSLIVLIIGILLMKSSIDKIINPSPVETGVWTFVVLGVAIAGKLWQGGLYKNFGKSIDSAALKAASADSRNDVISTAAVLISVTIAAFRPDVMLDGYIGGLVSLFIMVSALKMIKDTLNPLLGVPPEPELVKTICSKVMSYDGVLGIHDLIVHSYGPSYCFATLHVEVDAKVDIMVTHDLIDNIEREFNEKEHIFMVIHMDPIVTDDPEINNLRDSISEFVKQAVSPECTIHDLRLVRGVTHTNVLFDVVVPYGIGKDKKQITDMLTDRFRTPENNYYFVINIDNKYTA